MAGEIMQAADYGNAGSGGCRRKFIAQIAAWFLLILQSYHGVLAQLARYA
jgi:hypothetical protein